MQVHVPLLGIPVKPFGVAKQRLHPRLDGVGRSRLGREVAIRTARVASEAGAAVAFVTADGGVRRWATSYGFPTIDESQSDRSGLDGAAAAVRDSALAEERPWLVVPADLPLVAVDDVVALLEPLLRGQAVIAPSYDGGTSAFGGHELFEFSYGPGSYHRHLNQAPHASVIVRPGLAHDLDTVADLDAIVNHRNGRWIGELMAAIDSHP